MAHTARPSLLSVWASQVRARFLILAVLLVAIGGAAAHLDGAFKLLRFSLALVGVVLAHISVNLFNEHSDERTGIDRNTRRTPFSGGTGNIQAGHTSARSVLAVAVSTLLAALAIGIYLAATSGWLLLVFIVVGGISTVFYTSALARVMLGELSAGLSLGTFVVLGTYFALTGTLSDAVIWLSIPPGILTALLLLLNEFPDAEADRAGGRRHMVIVLGRRGAAVAYTAGLAACYGVLVGGVVAGLLPASVLLALLTLPLAVRAAVAALKHGDDAERLTPALGANVLTVLGTDLLMAVGCLINWPAA